jgi:16S rRNA (cytosine1402-N4)-methyltransferase
MSTAHIPVLLAETLDALQLRPGLTVLDGTLGGGGHALAICHALEGQGRLLALDRDPSAAGHCLLADQENRSNAFPLVHRQVGSYAFASEFLNSLGWGTADRILLDLGMSSDQLADASRGFSFRLDGPLDLRFHSGEGPTAAEVLAQWNEGDLADAIYQYGEERYSRRIARAIVQQRRIEPIRSTRQLHDLIHRVVPVRTHGRIDAATRTFQALRIVVNQELRHLEQGLKALPACLSPGGLLVVISFHSLEDRLVKNAFREHPLLERVTRKPIVASDREREANPRARSAKLRVARRLLDSSFGP